MARFTLLVALSLFALAQADQGCQAGECPVTVNSLLQATKHASGVDKENDVGPSILYDGKHVMESEFVRLPGQFAEEYLFSVDAAKFGIEVNDTHALIPMGPRIQFNFIRRWHTTEDEHVGVANQRFFENSVEIMPESLIASDIVVGVAEKMHVFSFTKDQDTSAYERAMADLHESDETGNKSEDFYERNALTIVAAGLATPPLTLWKSTGGASSEIMEFANGDDAPPSFAERASELRDAMHDTFAKLQEQGADFSDPKLTSTNCFHWGNDVRFDTDEELIYFPLGKKLNSYRGNQIASPYTSMSVIQGTSVFTYDPNTGMLEVYYGVAKESTVGDPYAEQPMGRTGLGPADGEGEPVGVPRWSDQRKSAAGSLAYQALQYRNRNYKADWTFLFRDYDEICPPDHYAKIEEWYGELQMMSSELSLEDLVEMAKVWLNIVQCSTSFLRPDQTHGAEFNEYMAMAAVHGLIEVPTRHAVGVFAARDWQDIDVSLIPGAR